MEQQIISREEAERQGLKRFFTGEPCKHGHISERKTNDKSCVECNREKTKRHAGATAEWREKNRGRNLAKMRERYENNKEEYKAKAKKWNKANPEKLAEAKREWRRSEKGLEQNRRDYQNNNEAYTARIEKWKAANPDKVREMCRTRQARQLQAMPAWADREAIKAKYAEACMLEEEDGIPRHVDHVIPLQGKNVCGLHVETNLEVKTATENLRKHNRFEVEAQQEEHIFEVFQERAEEDNGK